MEWQLEHKARGFGEPSMRKLPPMERVRGLISFVKQVDACLRNAFNSRVGSSAEMLYTTIKDAELKLNNGNAVRDKEAFLQSKRELGLQWDLLPDDHEDKVFFRRLSDLHRVSWQACFRVRHGMPMEPW